jgi:hypothetical protein
MFSSSAMTSSWITAPEFTVENLMLDGDGGSAAADAATEPPEKRCKTYEPCGLQTRERERNELGDPGERSGCFGCVYIGERETGAIPYEDIMALIDMIRQSIARTDPINLAMHIAGRYAVFQRKINDNLFPSEKPLPDWPAASILDHIRNHNTDPEVQTWVRLSELQELIQVALSASVERDEESGQHRINEKQCKMYMELVRAMETVYKSDPSKKIFYSGGAHIDMKVGAQGLIATAGKNIVDFWKQQ